MLLITCWLVLGRHRNPLVVVLPALDVKLNTMHPSRNNFHIKEKVKQWGLVIFVSLFLGRWG